MDHELIIWAKDVTGPSPPLRQRSRLRLWRSRRSHPMHDAGIEKKHTQHHAEATHPDTDSHSNLPAIMTTTSLRSCARTQLEPSFVGVAHCPECGSETEQVHRSAAQRVLYLRLYQCRMCLTYVARPRSWVGPFVGPSVIFILSRHTLCIRCGNTEVRRMSHRDYVDSMSKHPFAVLMRLTGAPLNRCQSCRLQYHDWRSIRAGRA